MHAVGGGDDGPGAQASDEGVAGFGHADVGEAQHVGLGRSLLDRPGERSEAKSLDAGGQGRRNH